MSKKDTKESKFSLEDEVYFVKYQRPVEHKSFRASTKAIIKEVTELDGQEAYLIESSQGHQETVLASEIKLNRPAGKLKNNTKKKTKRAATKEALEKTKVKHKKVESTEEEVTAQKEFKAMSDLLTDGAGNPLTLVITPEIEAILAQNDSLEATKNLYGMAQKNYMLVGGVLAHIQQEGLHKTYGYDGAGAFNRFIDEQMPFQSRTARYWMDIYVKFTNFDISSDIIGKLGGWSYAKDLARVVTADNKETLLKLGIEKGGQALSEYIKASYGRKESVRTEDITLEAAYTAPVKHTDSRFFEDEYENVYLRVMDVMKSRYPEFSEDLPKLGSLVYMEFSQTLDASSTGEITPENYVRYGKAAIGQNYEIVLKNKHTGEQISSEASDYTAPETEVNVEEQELVTT